MTEKKKVGIKESVLVTTVIGFVASLLFFMWMYETEDIQMLKIVLTIWCIFWLIIMIFGFNKGSILAFGAVLIKVATDKTLTTEEKLATMMLIIQEWLNIVALEQIANVIGKKEKKTKAQKLAELNIELEDLKKKELKSV